MTIEQWVKDLMAYAHGIQETHERFKQPIKDEQEGIDLNNTKTQWALSCDAVGDDRYWED